MFDRQQADWVSLLRSRAQELAERQAFIFLENGESVSNALTYGELDLKARQLAARLQAENMQGERAVLLYPQGLDYIVAFFACLYAGVIAAPAYPPANARHRPRLQAIIDDSQAALILTTQAIASTISQWEGSWAKKCRMTDGLSMLDASAWIQPVLNADDTAFLQYTSGSTGNAKGVRVSHGNLMANQALIKHRFGHDEQSIVVGWLPLYHDMGLIGNVMQPLYCGASAVLMSPMAFLEKPVRWLKAIGDHGAYTSGGPNFAYELCARKITDTDKSGLDLSRWRLAFNGAEPVNPDTLDRFVAAFEACGFRRRAFYPCYGLAEATLLATGADRHAEPHVESFDKASLQQGHARVSLNRDESSRRLVGCGRIDLEANQSMRIVDPDSGEPYGEGRVGEIQLGGPSICRGYWQNSGATTEAFIEDAEGFWLKTGDLGFISADELYVSGRLKDLIIVRGRNYYPHDIEYAAEAATDALNPGCIAAFALNGDSGERLIVLAELKRNRLRQVDHSAVFAAIRRRLVEECGIEADTIMFLKPGSIFKTSSGKIRRSDCRRAFEQGLFESVAIDSLNSEALAEARSGSDQALLRQSLLSSSEGERLLVQLIAGKLQASLAIDTLDPAQSMTSLGLDSLKAVDLKYFIDALLGIDLSLDSLLGHHSLAECAEKALNLAKTGHGASALAWVQDAGEQPLSFGQLAIWTGHHTNAVLYNMPLAMRIHAAIDRNALQSALDAVFKRHAQLQSVFRSNRQGQTVRIRLPEARCDWLEQSCGDESQRRQAVHAFMRKAFDLQTGPLLRAGLFSLAGRDHVLAFCAHHIVVDFRSLAILLEDIEALYCGERFPDPEGEHGNVNHVDYVAWQSAYLASDCAEQDWLYWQEQLSGDIPKLNLSAESKVSSSASGRIETLSISSDRLQKLKSLAAENSTTLYTLLLAVFKTLLYRYSGQHDIIVGSPTLGRPRRDFAETVGYFVNPVAVRSHPFAAQRFTDYLAGLNQTVLDALAHQHYPLSLLVEKLRPEQGAFYKTWFALQSSSDPDFKASELALGLSGLRLNWAGLPVETYALDEVSAQFDLALLMAETREGLAACFEYRSDVFSRESVLGLIGHFQILLDSILDDPTQRLSELSLLSEPELKQLDAWNETALDDPRDQAIHRWFEAQASQKPQAIALAHGETDLSYGELNAQANRLAHHLMAQGVSAEMRIALCMPRCPEWLVGLLAILKSGAVYVPIDPANPGERLHYLIQDAGVEFVLTCGSMRQSLSGVKTIDVDEVEAYAHCSPENPEIDLHPEHAAYVIYTSGSTGNPKGVTVSHGNLMHSTWARHVYYPEPVACYLMLSSFAFDSSAAGLFWTLSQGGCLCLPTDDQIKQPKALAHLIETRQATHLLALPSLYELLLEQASMLKSLKTVIVAGEACRQPLSRLHFERLPDVLLFNEYGPTEATVWSSVYPIDQAFSESSIPIGKPIPNARLYVLDEALQRVALGVAGELTVGGAGISRGYLGKPGLTAEKFIPDPFGAVGGRLYKTGDKARYRSDGVIEFLGRIDHQVKIRGFRIELGEIEACLLSHPAIKSAAVAVREDVPGNLAAYLVFEPGSQPESDALKAYVKGRLPEYMLPSSWIFLDSMPLNANGKLDRKALQGFKPQNDKVFVAPRDAAEEAVADIWREVLGVEKLSIHDDFFELGGHSLSGVQVTARVQALFDIEVPVNLLFEATTLAQFVDRLAAYEET